MTTAVVTTASALKTAPTKTLQKHVNKNEGDHLLMKTCNNQSSSNTKTEHTTFHQMPT
jgi:hypothetical protein